MQFKIFLLIGIYIGLLCPCIQIGAQELRTNEKGEKIIVYPDGSWQYFTNFGVTPGALFDPKDSPNYQSPEPEDKFPVFSGIIAPMDNLYVNTEEDARKIMVRRAQIAQDAVSTANKRASEAARRRQLLEQELNEAVSKGVSDETLQQLRIRLQATRKTETETAREANQARQEAGRADELTRKGNYLKELAAQQSQRIRQPESSRLLLEDFYKNVMLLDEATGSTRPAETTAVKPPLANCKVAFEGTDEHTRAWRRDMQQQLLFTFTDERLRIYLKDKEYLRCEGFMTSTGGFRFLSLQFSFAYPNAREAYGFIEKGSVLIIKLLNGDFVTLTANKMDRGSYDTTREILTYQVHYAIDRSLVSILKRSEVDSIIMFWSSGYEEYEVFNVDFFTNQLQCLEK
ncbi:MAG TPA: hypothetical protein PKD70_00955 [Saprospiraceae bacterium]|nr:hypothetical protein [Saprospiraceae bacterium]HMP12414.1 hypothetical protein [Saprospiraceae bacterium]